MATDGQSLLSRSMRIKILLVIDSAFFFLELIVGYSVGSLALVADSFHMLNDVCSLLVALYAIHLAGASKRTQEYSYGWQRAEILGALINGVFLLALCFSIFLEAIQRAFDPPDIKNPILVVIVGTLGLASNVLGLLLFHEHGHSHSHSHKHSHNSHSDVEAINTQPTTYHDHDHQHQEQSIPIQPSIELNKPDERSRLLSSSTPVHSHVHDRNKSSSVSLSSSFDSSESTLPIKSRKRHSLLDEIWVHPAQTRNNILRAAELKRDQMNHHHQTKLDPTEPGTQESQLDSFDQQHNDLSHPHSHSHSDSHSHSHMNMRAIFLHALGDALGNVGVILTGLLIWLVPRFDGEGRPLGNRWVLYADPGISLAITIIIFTSALPLVRSASLILLQGTPPNVNLGKVQETIQAIRGVLQVHELHIWSLSESKLVASVHVLIESQDDFISISRQIRKCLHHHGIHSSTIQPEILMEEQINSLRVKLGNNGSTNSIRSALGQPTSDQVTKGAGGVGQRVKSFLLSRQSSTHSKKADEIFDGDGCLVQCDEACDQEACCPPGSIVSMSVNDNQDEVEHPSTSSRPNDSQASDRL